jgi:hypothetical protein
MRKLSSGPCSSYLPFAFLERMPRALVVHARKGSGERALSHLPRQVCWRGEDLGPHGMGMPSPVRIHFEQVQKASSSSVSNNTSNAWNVNLNNGNTNNNDKTNTNRAVCVR